MEVEFKKLIVYKLYDKEDNNPSEVKYFTLKGLRHHVINVLWVEYDDTGADINTQGFSQVELTEDDAYIFTYLENWGYTIERITIFDTKEVYTTKN